MQPPIIIHDSREKAASGDLRVYSSVDIALSSLEEDDLSDAYLHFWDSEGTELKLYRKDEYSAVSLVKCSSRGNDVHVLEKVLRDFGSQLGVESDWIEKASIEDMLALYYRRDQNPYTD